MKEFGAELRRQCPFLDYAPVVFGSALKREGVRELLDAAADVANNHAMRVATGELNRVIHEDVRGPLQFIIKRFGNLIAQ